MSEVDKLRRVFWNNGYSNSFFEKVLQCFENKNLQDKNSDTDPESSLHHMSLTLMNLNM